MSTTFPTSLTPAFSEVPVDPELKLIFDEIIGSAAFVNHLADEITAANTAVTTATSTLDTLVSDLESLAGSPPATWVTNGNDGADIQAIADDIQTIIDNEITTVTAITATFKTHTDRLSGVSINDTALTTNNMMILYAVALAWMSISFTHDDQSNKVPLMFGSLFTGDDAVSALTSNINRVVTDLLALDLIDRIDEAAPANIPADDVTQLQSEVAAIVGTSAQRTALAALPPADDAQFNIAMNFIRASAYASSIKGHAQQDFEGWIFRNLIGSTSLNVILDDIEIIG